MNKAVFLDRDGTLIEEKDYLYRVDQVQLLPGSVAGLQRLREAGFKLIIISNQSGIGRGYFTMADVDNVHRHLAASLAAVGVWFDKIYIAPEAPGVPSRGRKPSPQFIFDARDEFNLELNQCYMIGDKWIDLQCGWNAGVRQSLLVRTGYGAQVEREAQGRPEKFVVVDDLDAAAQWIIADAP